jgi:hypothetical protein
MIPRAEPSGVALCQVPAAMDRLPGRIGFQEAEHSVMSDMKRGLSAIAGGIEWFVALSEVAEVITMEAIAVSGRAGQGV